MIDGNVKEFVDELYYQDHTVRYNGHLYWFYGVTYDPKTNLRSIRVDEFNEDIHHFSKEMFPCESESADDCLKHLLEDKYWDGENFWQIQHKMRWVDG